MRNDVRECPFCGSNEIVVEQYNHLAGCRFRVVCSECMANVDTGCFQNNRQAVDAWNKRVYTNE
jgi:Lar family restriction alleviation protein